MRQGLVRTCKLALGPVSQSHVLQARHVQMSAAAPGAQVSANPAAPPVAAAIPEGFLYVPNVFTKEEQRRILRTIDEHEYSHAIHRRQQFYGPVYYHTPFKPKLALQPGADPATAVAAVGDDGAGSPEAKAGEPAPAAAAGGDRAATSHKSDAVVSHDLAPLQWVVDKLIRLGLFVETDPARPLVQWRARNRGDQRACPSSSEEVPVSGAGGPYFEEIDCGEPATLPLAPGAPSSSSSSSSSVSSTSSATSSRFPVQILVNEYVRQQGIGNHFDDPLSFGDMIVGITLDGGLVGGAGAAGARAGAEAAAGQVLAEGGQEDAPDDPDEPLASVVARGGAVLALTQPLCIASADFRIRKARAETSARAETEAQEGPGECKGACTTSGAACGRDIEDCAKATTSTVTSIRGFVGPDWTVRARGPQALASECLCARAEWRQRVGARAVVTPTLDTSLGLGIDGSPRANASGDGAAPTPAVCAAAAADVSAAGAAVLESTVLATGEADSAGWTSPPPTLLQINTCMCPASSVQVVVKPGTQRTIIL